MKCNAKTEVWTRVCGFFRPVQQWNKGKKSEYADRVEYELPDFSGDLLAWRREFLAAVRELDGEILSVAWEEYSPEIAGYAAGMVSPSTAAGIFCELQKGVRGDVWAGLERGVCYSSEDLRDILPILEAEFKPSLR